MNGNNAFIDVNSAKADYDATSCNRDSNSIYGYISVYMEVSTLINFFVTFFHVVIQFILARCLPDPCIISATNF